MRRARCLILAAAFCTAMAPSGSAAANDASLEPYQMVRSLQLVQDRIASGDHAALPMQKKLLEMIDSRFQSAGAVEFSDPKNFRSLLIYGMSGGNPSTLNATLQRLELEPKEKAIAGGVLHYLTGETLEARRDLGTIEPEANHSSLAASLSLVKGAVIAADDPTGAIRLYDRARLLAPGTLVEETALRRSVALASELDDPEKFMSVSGQYVRRFLRSPYAAQFADSFVSALGDFAGRIDTPELEEVVSWMSPEQERTVYLRLSRISAIAGHEELLAFASAKTRDYPGETADRGDARSKLYANISSVTSASVGDVLDRLETLDPTGLSRRDRALLKAAKTVAREVVAPATTTAAILVDAPAQPGEDDIPSPASAGEAPSDEMAVTDGLISAARSKLEAIDAMLEEVE